uniref:Prefoldin subunit 2 n=1 Tax=Callorhinchus milii TaxID=7868 RepID=A0A4W3GUY0_CALMI
LALEGVQRRFTRLVPGMRGLTYEDRLVIDTLKEVEPTRKCYRMVGGVLVERTVKEVLPALEINKEQLAKLIDSFATQMVSKGKELNEFRAKHDIRLVNEEKMSRESEGAGKSGSAGVLVSE